MADLASKRQCQVTVQGLAESYRGYIDGRQQQIDDARDILLNSKYYGYYYSYDRYNKWQNLYPPFL